MKIFIPFLIGAIFGSLAVLGFQGVRKFGNEFWAPTRIHESSSHAREKIENSGIDLPGDAYDLDYFYYAGRDYTRWIGFSASNDQLDLIVRKLSEKRINSGNHTVPNRLPEKPEYWIEESTVGDWWPTSSKGMKVTKGDFFWIAHDTINERVYYYTFSM